MTTVQPPMTLSSSVFDNTPLLFGGGVTGLPAWYDTSLATYLTLDGSAITQLLDRSGNANHTDVQATGSKRFNFNSTGLNSLGIAEADGGDTLELPSALYTIPSTENTIVAVVKRTSEDASVDSILTMSESGATRFDLAFDSTSGQLNYRSNDIASGDVQKSGATNTDFQIMIGRRDTSGNQAISFNNGTEAINGNAVNEPGIDSAFIGSANDSSNFLIGAFAEILLYNTLLSTGDMFVLYEYMSQKWNITI